MIESLLDKDTALFLFLNALGNSTWDGFWLLVTNKLTTIPIYVFLTYLLYRKWGAKKTAAFFLFALLMLTFSDQLANIFKYGFKRLRPCHETSLAPYLRLVKSHCGGQYSFFSAHASTGMALAVFFGNFLKQYSKIFFIALITLAFFVAYSRIYIGVHYPLDVLVGVFFGSIIGILFYKTFKIFSNKYLKT